MNWNDLRVFLAIAEAGSLAGAARHLGNNHSTVFRRLEALESDLDARLFERHAGGYSLTPAGERMLALARPVAESIDAISRDVAGRDLALRGPVRLTTAPNLARYIVPAALVRLRQQHPGIVVEVSVADSDYDLNRREADLALRATLAPPDHLIGQHLATIDWWVCAAAGAASLPGSESELDEHPLIGADESLRRLPALRWLEQGRREQVVARANDLTTMAALARAGIGLAVLPGDQPPDGLQRLFPIPDIHGELWLLTHPDLRGMRRVRVVWEALAAAVNESMAALAAG